MLWLYLVTRIAYILLFKQYKALNLTPINIIMPNTSIHYPCMLNYCKTKDFLEKVWPANLALFVNVSMCNIEAVT